MSWLNVRKTRGVRNNNPGNIRINPNFEWDGQLAPENFVNEDGEIVEKHFCVFVTPEYGCRALAKLIKNYITRKNIKTIDELINTYAPGHENPTDKYVSYIESETDVVEPLQADFYTILSLMKAIIYFENGGHSYPTYVLVQGILMAEIALPENRIFTPFSNFPKDFTGIHSI